MSAQAEKKFRVQSFDEIQKVMTKLGAVPTIDICTTHYYARLGSDDTIKMIDYKDRIEIHKLKTNKGVHTLEEGWKVDSIEEGFAWFSVNGYDTLDVLEMHNREYAYKNGEIALYEVDATICSIIIGYPEEVFPEIERALGLHETEVITLPFNRYLQKIGKLRTVNI